MSQHRRRIPPVAWLLLLFSAALAVVFLLRDSGHHPVMDVSTPDGVSLGFVLRTYDDERSCRMNLNRLRTAVLARCPRCVEHQAVCASTLTTEQQEVLTDQPLAWPVSHLPDGVVVFRGPDPAANLNACRESEKLTPRGINIKCYVSGEARQFYAAENRWIDTRNLAFALLVLVIAQLIVKLVCYLIIRYEHLHAKISYDTNEGPQKFHALPTPRIGGVAVMLSLLLSAAILTVLPQQFPDKEFGILLLAALPAFLGGVTEDITKSVTVVQRLLLTMLSAGFAIWLLGGLLTRIDLPWGGEIALWLPLAVAFTVFAVAGVTNAVNLIDGYNGIAAGFGVLVSAALAFVSARVGDAFLLTANLAMAGALLGFLVWNWPSGKIFLGDGGAYLIGFWLAEMSVLLVVRHPQISVWLPLLLMIYPVFETLFSIYRRKILRGRNPGRPDALHLHQLIYCRLIRQHVGTKTPVLKIWRNSRVVLYVLGLNLVFVAAGVVFWKSAWVLLGLCVAFCVLYSVLYFSVLTFRAPAWLIKSDSSSVGK